MSDTTCSSCPYYIPPKAEANVAYATGTCQRFPTHVTKLPNGSCGEHPTFMAMRDRDLAKTIAGLVAEVDRQVAAAAVPAAAGNGNAQPQKSKRRLFRA